MDHLDKEVIESLSEPAKRVFKSLDYRSKQRMLKKAREMVKAEKMIRRKKRRFKKKGIEKLNKGKKQKKGSSSKSERVLFSIHETRELMVQSMHLMLFGSSVADDGKCDKMPIAERQEEENDGRRESIMEKMCRVPRP